MARPVVYDNDARDALLDAAARTVHESGVQALTLRSLARDTGTTTAAVYALFGGKDGLLEALYARAVAAFAGRLDAAPAGDDAVENLIALGLAYRASGVSDPHGYRVMFGGHIDAASLSPESGRLAARTFAILVDRVRTAQQAGALTGDAPAEAIATSLWAHTHGLVLLELDAPSPPGSHSPEAVAELALRAHVRGWAPR